MDTAMIKEQLHDYIERADEKHLEAMYVMLGKEIESSKHHYDEATLKILYQRVENDKNGISKSNTVEEAFRSIREAYKSKK